MGEIKDYIWTVPLIGGIIALGAFFAPAAYVEEYNDYLYLWMWALLSYQFYDPYWGTDKGVVFTDNPDILIPSIVCSVIIFLCILALIGSSLLYRKRMRNGKVNPIVWLGASICILGFTIAWIIIIEVVMSSGLPSFWSYMNPGFGVIGMFIGSILSIIGYGVAKISMKQKREPIQLPSEGMPIIVKQESTTPTTSIPIGKTKFCPECGTKLSKENQKFCMDCGTEI